jgi:hypothetical protein
VFRHRLIFGLHNGLYEPRFSPGVHILKSRNLNILRLTNTRATDRGIAELEGALPGLTVEK